MHYHIASHLGMCSHHMLYELFMITVQLRVLLSISLLYGSLKINGYKSFTIERWFVSWGECEQLLSVVQQILTLNGCCIVVHKQMKTTLGLVSCSPLMNIALAVHIFLHGIHSLKIIIFLPWSNAGICRYYHFQFVIHLTQLIYCWVIQLVRWTVIKMLVHIFANSWKFVKFAKLKTHKNFALYSSCT